MIESVDLVVITDGRRDHIGDTIRSAGENLHGAPVERRWIYDDSGDVDNLRWLERRFPEFDVWQHPAGRQGFGGAIREVWRRVVAEGRGRFVFHLEDDFTFNRPVNLAHLAEILDDRPELVQLALRRQPWNDEERRAGGIVEQHPGDYVDRSARLRDGTSVEWLEHRRFFTTNPSLYRAELANVGWPEGDHSEGRFGVDLLRDDPDRRFGYWGARSSGEWVTHNGHTRNGTGY